MKRFLKQPGGADVYRDLEVRFVPGANPDLLLFEEGNGEPQRTDLTAFSSQLDLHKLVLSKGFALRDDADAPPVLCEDWSSQGECDANPGFMHTRCAYACANKDDL